LEPDVATSDSRLEIWNHLSSLNWCFPFCSKQCRLMFHC